ncbi:MAG TPA: VC0807 family protein [Allosphingosinicella sp.]|nr:VC0807 family protein [Allosphingosinicella sp.]
MATSSAQTDKPPRLRNQAAHFLRHRAGAIAIEIVVNFLFPMLIYDWIEPMRGEIVALMASSAAPILWGLIEFARVRRIDAVSLLALAGIALSLLAFAGGGSVHFLQLREKLVTSLVGLIFLGSAAIGKPLIYELARAGMQRKNSTAELAEFEALRDNRGFRRTMMVMTLVWGSALVAEGLVAGALVFLIPVRAFFVVGPVLGYGVMGAVTLWTIWYGRRQRRKGEARRREAARLAGESSDDAQQIEAGSARA